jgi:hypothetical protein
MSDPTEAEDIPSQEEPDQCCPNCKESSVEQDDSPIVENARIYLPMYCHMCEATWLVYYDMGGYKSLNIVEQV